MTHLWTYEYFRLAAGLLVFAASLLLRQALSRFVVNQLKRLATKQELAHILAIIDTIFEPLRFGIVVVGLYAAIKVAWVPDPIADGVALCVHSLLIFTLFWLFYRMVDPISEGLTSVTDLVGGHVNSDLSTLLTTTVKALVVFVGAMTFLQQWGINVAAFLGGLGLAGMAVALAAQDTVKNFFGSLTIFADQTFKKGEQIKTADVEGTVEKMGLRTTTLRQTDKALVVVPNAKLADAPIVNVSRITEYFVRWSIPLEVDVSSVKLEKALKRIREALSTHPDIEMYGKKTPLVIRLDKFSEGSIELLCHFFIKKMLWEDYMRAKEECLFLIKRILEEEAIPLTPSYSMGYSQARALSKIDDPQMQPHPKTPRQSKTKRS